jgi:hypothetical protein
MFGPRRDEVTGEWRKLHNEELYNLYCSPSIIGMVKSRRMGWAKHPERMGKEECMQVIGRNARRKDTSRRAKT